jgi:hypothetical protein
MRLRPPILAAACALGALALSAPTALAAQPTIETPSATHIRTDSATLEALVNPGEKATTYRFEYGTSDCSSNPCTKAPAKDGVIAKGKSPVALSETIEGLTPGTTYHFRVFAKNPDATSGITSLDQTFRTYDLPPTFGPCPNDDLRLHNPTAASLDYSSANLPDCRVYEQVSPVDKNGTDALAASGLARASESGDAVTFNTSTGIPGGEGSQDFPTYLATRGTGWSTQGLLPSALQGANVRIIGWTRDFSEVFEVVSDFGNPDAALLMRSADGETSVVVPRGLGLTGTGSAGQPSFVGTSADGSIVFFESRSKLVPEAIAAKSNLYVWDRESGHLSLAGLLNDETSPPAGSIGGAYDWDRSDRFSANALSRGGGSLEPPQPLQDEHAVTATGDVFFTAAATGQLYERRNPTQPQSAINGEHCTEAAKACTIHVSASQRGTPDPLGSRPAAFMGASDDGSKAFFTSPEELTNDSITGPEVTTVPTVARADIGGNPDSVDLDFLLPQRAHGVTAAGGYLYWADPSKGSIGRAKLTGNPEVDDEFIVPGKTHAEVFPKTEPGVEQSAPTTPQYVTVAGEFIYWTNTGPLGGENRETEEHENHPVDGAGTIGRAKLGLGGPEDIDPEFITGASNPTGIDVDDTSTYVYWGNGGSTTATRTIGRAELVAGNVEEANQTFIKPVATGNYSPQGIVLSATHIYAALNLIQDNRSFFSLVQRFDFDGSPASGNFSLLGVNSTTDIQGIALDSTYLYWGDRGDESLSRIPIADFGTSNTCLSIPSCEPEFINGAGRPLGLAADADHLYWSANQEIPPNPGNDLYEYDARSAQLTDLTPDPDDENGAEVQGVLGASEDGTVVYFAADAVLAPGASPRTCAAGGVCETNIYKSEGGEVQFVGRDPSIAGNWSVTKGAQIRKARVSADGKTLLYRSDGLRIYRDGDGAPGDCISCPPTGEGARGLGMELSLPYLIPNTAAAVFTHSLSADGTRAFFTSKDALVISDTNGDDGCPIVGFKGGSGTFSWPSCQDVYEWEAQGSGTCEEASSAFLKAAGGCLYILSDGSSPYASFLIDASASGDDVFLASRDRLVGQDQDSIFDIYDARSGGGLASQSQPPAPSPCEAESCMPAATPTPPTADPQTSNFQGPSDAKPKPRKRCPKGKLRRGKRCLKHHHASKARSRDGGQRRADR